MVAVSRNAWQLEFVALSVIVATLCGCAHRGSSLRDARSAFLLGDLDSAEQYLDESASKKAEEVLLADKAMIRLLRGDVQSSEALLRQVRDAFDHLEQQDLGEEALALVSDDRRRAYSGEDYEKILVRNFLAIANLLNENDDALAYCLQATRKQHEILSKNAAAATVVPTQRVSLADYLYGVVREASHTHYDDAQRAYATIVQTNPSFRSAALDLERVRTASHSLPGNGVVYLIALVGPGPVKEEVTAPVTSQSLAIAGHLLNAIGDYEVPSFSAPVKIPSIVIPTSAVDAVALHVNGNPQGVTDTITDVAQLAFEQYQANQNHAIARAVARRVLKKAAVHTAKEELADNTWSAIALEAMGFVWEAREAADTRCWRTLPGSIQVLRCELPAGEHDVSLSPLFRGHVVGETHHRSVQVVDGRNTYILVCFPDQRLAGDVIVSGSGAGVTAR